MSIVFGDGDHLRIDRWNVKTQTKNTESDIEKRAIGSIQV